MRSITVSFLISSCLCFQWRAQSAILLQILVQPSLSGRFSSGLPLISIQSCRSKKLLSLKANAKSAFVKADTPPLVNSDSIPILGSNRSVPISKFLILSLSLSLSLSLWPRANNKDKRKREQQKFQPRCFLKEKKVWIWGLCLVF